MRAASVPFQKPHMRLERSSCAHAPCQGVAEASLLNIRQRSSSKAAQAHSGMSGLLRYRAECGSELMPGSIAYQASKTCRWGL